MESSHSFEPCQKTLFQSGSYPHRIGKNSQKSHTQGISLENLKENDWLSHEFSRFPFLFYRIWLVLNFTMALIFDIGVIRKVWDSYTPGSSSDFILPFSIEALLCMSSVPLLYGCAEMLIAISRKRAQLAQQSLLKLEYYLICSLICVGFVLSKDGIPKSFPQWLFLIYLAVLPFVDIIGCLAVLRIFKNNHPLTKLDHNDLNKDFLEQNEALAAEVANFDRQLNIWPYKIYKWWLKFAVMLELILILNHSLYQILKNIPTIHQMPLWGFLLLFWLFLSSCLSCFAVLTMETAMRVKTLAKVKRAILLLKIAAVFSIVFFVIATRELIFDAGGSEWKIYVPVLFVYCVPFSTLTLIGSFFVRKIIEKRDQFVQASSYTNDSYL